MPRPAARLPASCSGHKTQGHNSAVAIANFANRFGMSKLPNCVPTLIALSEIGSTETKELAAITISGLSSQSDQLENGSVSALISLLQEKNEEGTRFTGPTEPLPQPRGTAALVSEVVTHMPHLTRTRVPRDAPENWELSKTFDDALTVVPQLAAHAHDDNIIEASEVLTVMTDRVHSHGAVSGSSPMEVPCEKVRAHDTADDTIVAEPAPVDDTPSVTPTKPRTPAPTSARRRTTHRNRRLTNARANGTAGNSNKI